MSSTGQSRLPCPPNGQGKYFYFYSVLYPVHSIPPYLSEGWSAVDSWTG